MIKSEYEFYEIFVLLSEKIKINIPDTGLMKGGRLSTRFTN